MRWRREHAPPKWRPGRPGRPLALAALAACGGADGPAEEPALRLRGHPTGVPPLLAVDLSDEAVTEMTLGQLWAVGVELLGWPHELPAEATKEGVHQRLLEIKLADVGDFSDEGYGDAGYTE